MRPPVPDSLPPVEVPESQQQNSTNSPRRRASRQAALKRGKRAQTAPSRDDEAEHGASGVWPPRPPKFDGFDDDGYFYEDPIHGSSARPPLVSPSYLAPRDSGLSPRQRAHAQRLHEIRSSTIHTSPHESNLPLTTSGVASGLATTTTGSGPSPVLGLRRAQQQQQQRTASPQFSPRPQTTSSFMEKLGSEVATPPPITPPRSPHGRSPRGRTAPSSHSSNPLPASPIPGVFADVAAVYTDPAATPLAGCAVQTKQRQLFDSLQETIRILQISNEGMLERIRYLEHEANKMLVGEVHPQTVVDQLDEKLRQVEDERDILDETRQRHELELSRLVEELTAARGEKASAQEHAGRLAETLRKMKEEEAAGGEMAEEDAAKVSTRASLAAPLAAPFCRRTLWHPLAS